MEGKFYGAEKFKPKLIITQMMVMQSSFAICLASTATVFDLFSGNSISLWQLFQGNNFTWDNSAGCSLFASLCATGFAMAFLLSFVVERAKKCLDFVATYHFFHLVATCILSGFPGNYQWWVMHGVALAIAVFLGEYICMQAETQAITLTSKSNKAKQRPKKPAYDEI
eukprot:CAMPEP_0206494876 /NCGR_PEP_ID=MMETSP0324_2-20121206/48054_1 /ASSEMBLY_ACC=CAM_ASM_000836 /TAXON_ID=2866 /ORGANISM="Crypthecodinium cohnii, Strain Seligo" /LENGTH=167 /DNA_ID=CAMNT_0053978745 /DNA_START=44 /DNA_END=547 /DNA_ORIENTATION=-